MMPQAMRTCWSDRFTSGLRTGPTDGEYNENVPWHDGTPMTDAQDSGKNKGKDVEDNYGNADFRVIIEHVEEYREPTG